MEYRVYAALLLYAGAIERLEINRLHASIHASPNRLKTGLQTNEKTLAAASDSPSTLQLFNPSTAGSRLPAFRHGRMAWYTVLAISTAPAALG